MVAGVRSPKTSTEAEEYVKEAASLTGLEPDFDSITVDPQLDENVPAATRFKKKGLYETTDFVENPYAFQQLSKGEKLNASAHEILESKQMNGFLGEELKQSHQISEEFADFLNYAQTEFPNSIREGMTQAITNTILPDGERTGKNFYPEETDVFETIVEGAGFDLKEELFEEAKEEVSDDYGIPEAEIYDFEIADDIYYESGEVGGVKYEFMAVGDKMSVYGPDLANQYKRSVIDYVPPGSGMYDLDSLDSIY